MLLSTLANKILLLLMIRILDQMKLLLQINSSSNKTLWLLVGENEKVSKDKKYAVIINSKRVNKMINIVVFSSAKIKNIMCMPSESRGVGELWVIAYNKIFSIRM